MKNVQEPVADRVARDRRPVQEWARSMERLPQLLYAHDPELSRRLEVFVRRIASSAANLDCIGTDDPAAPPVGAPATDVLAYFFRVWPEDGAEFRRLIARADQLLGRQQLLELTMAREPNADKN